MILFKFTNLDEQIVKTNLSEHACIKTYDSIQYFYRGDVLVINFDTKTGYLESYRKPNIISKIIHDWIDMGIIEVTSIFDGEEKEMDP